MREETSSTCCQARLPVARRGPSPYGEKGSDYAVARGPVPRERSRSGSGDPELQSFRSLGMARDRPSPYDEKRRLSRSAGACPPRSLHGEGQARALRYFTRARHGEGQALALR